MNLVGKVIGKYQIIEEIGRGGMATVYKAWDSINQRYVALKVLPPYFQHDAEFIKRFRREAVAAAKLDHPNIVKVYEAGEEGGINYIAMEYIEGGSLQRRLTGKPLDLSTAISIVSQIGSALAYAHKRGIIHRDVKPSNILLTEEGRALLSDFGIARVSEYGGITRTGTLIGTPEYMSPEQAEGEEVDHRSDIYSLGIVLYQMLTGRVPFTGDTPLAVLHKQIYEKPTSPRVLNPMIPAEVEKVLLKALAKRPEWRYQSAEEMVAALQGAVFSPKTEVIAPSRGEPATIKATPVMPPAALGRREVSAFPWVIAIIGVLFAIGLALMWGGMRGVLLTSTPVSLNATSTILPLTIQSTSTPTISPTASPVPTPTRRPTKTPTPTPLPDAVVNTRLLNLRSGPGTEYPILGNYPQGTALRVLGKEPEGKWLKVRAPDGKEGWMLADYLVVNLALAKVPVVEIPPTPTPTWTPVLPTFTPTPVLPTPSPTPTLAPPTPPPPPPPPPPSPTPTLAPPAPPPPPTPTLAPP